MGSESKFEREIAATVTAWDNAGKELVPAFITHEIITRHEPGLARTNEHTEFFRHYAYKGHRKDVGQYIAKLFGDDDDKPKSAEQFLPGFEYVQRRYVVKRGADEVAVLVEQMTDDEIDARVQLLKRRGRTCLAHADELARFKVIRANPTESRKESA